MDITINKRKVFVILANIFIFGLVAAIAQDFGEIDNIVANFSDSGKKTIGSLGSYVIGLGTLALAGVGAFLAVKQAKKKAEQQGEGGANVAVAGLIGGVVGIVIALVVILLFGQVFLGDKSLGLQILYDFWKSAFGV